MDDQQRALEQARAEMDRLRQRRDPDDDDYLGTREAMAELPGPRVTFEPSEPRALKADDAIQLVGMVFRSRSGNTQPHIVTLRPDGSVQCICDAHIACWAQKAFRQVRGMQ